MGVGIITLRRASIILAVVHVAVDIAVIVRVGPRGTGKTADCRANRGALDHTDAWNDSSDGRATDSADRGVLGDT